MSDVLAMIERTVNAVETSGDDYAVTMVRYVLGIVLQLRDHAAAQDRGLQILKEIRPMCVEHRYPMIRNSP